MTASKKCTGIGHLTRHHIEALGPEGKTVPSSQRKISKIASEEIGRERQREEKGKKGRFNTLAEVVEEEVSPEGKTAAAKRLLASLLMHSEGPARNTYRVWNDDLSEYDVFELVDGEDVPQPGSLSHFWLRTRVYAGRA